MTKFFHVYDWRWLTHEEAPEQVRSSHEGKVYIAENGNKFFVKRMVDQRQTACEFVANLVYKHLGVKVPGSTLCMSPRGWVLVNGWLVGGELFCEYRGLGKGNSRITKEDFAKEFVENIAIDVWLTNYDAAGLCCDNVMAFYSDLYRLDNGGALLYRARGKPKDPDELWMPVEKDLESYFYGGSGGRDGYSHMMSMAGLHSPKDEVFLEIWKRGVERIEDMARETKQFQDFIPDNPLLNQYKNEIISVMQRRLEIIRMTAL